MRRREVGSSSGVAVAIAIALLAVAALAAMRAIARADDAATAPGPAPAAAVTAPAPAPAPAAPAAPPLDQIWLSLPSIDGATGAELGVERLLPERRLAVALTLGARKSAAGDYRGVAGGAGLEARWFWRGRALWTPLPRGAAVGWFVGGRGSLGLAHTTDVADDRDLGTTLSLGLQGLAGYRVVPWRGLAITAGAGLGFTNDHDLRGRLPPWTRPLLSVELTVGWMF